MSLVNIAHAQQSVFQGTWIEEDDTSMRIEISGNKWSYYFDDTLKAGGTAKFFTGQAQLLLANGEIYFDFKLLGPGRIEYSTLWRVLRFRLTQPSSNSQNNSGTQNSSSTSTAQDFYNSGLVHASKGNYDRAIAEFTQSIKINPNYADAYNNRGLAYYNKGNKDDYDKAIADYTQAIKINSNYADAYFNRGSLYQVLGWELGEIGYYDRAIADYTQVIKLNPSYYDMYILRGEMYHKKGDYDRAIADLTQAIKINPNSAEAYCGRGFAYHKKGDYDRAIAEFTQAIKINPIGVGAIYTNRGNVYEDKGDYDRAIADYTEAIRINPDDIWAKGYLYNVQQKRGR